MATDINTGRTNKSVVEVVVMSENLLKTSHNPTVTILFILSVKLSASLQQTNNTVQMFGGRILDRTNRIL